MDVVLVSWTGVVPLARSSVRHAVAAGARVTLLDLDGSFHGEGARVRRPGDLDLDESALRRGTLAVGPRAIARRLQPVLVRAVGGTPLVIEAGLLLLARLEALTDAAAHGMATVARDPGQVPPDGRHPAPGDLAAAGTRHSSLVAVRSDADAALDLWAAIDGEDARWLDVVAAVSPETTLHDPAVLIGAWTLRPEHRVDGGVATAGSGLTLDGRPVHAVDLSRVDPAAPWLLDPDLPDPRARLSDHPALAALVAAEAALWATEPRTPGTWDPERTPGGLAVDDVLRRAATIAGTDGPDLLDPAQAEAATAWLATPAPGTRLGPYLRALHARHDLASTFPRVPGADETAFLAWARTHAVADGVPASLLEPALAAVGDEPSKSSSGRPSPGVNVVGFLGSELGIGESARLLISALRAAGVPYATTSVDRFSQSRARAGGALGGVDAVFDTTVICVNSDLTPTVAPAVTDLMDRSYRVGMWYWEVEDFPATQHGGFDVLDEVWVATDFVRRAIEPHSPVPVRTLTPPLPQRSGEPAVSRAELGLPDRPYLLFSFDFLSTAERKNPMGLLEAFTRAFAADAGPLLVLKSINADKRPAQAERLRLAAAGRPDVLLLEEHLDAPSRDALVAHCSAYVSLHRAEGLGLTMAEAMAWGKPVIATGYSGNLQFMTEQNSFLVPYSPALVPDGAPPYPAGGTWADPDLDEAARLMSSVWDSPAAAAERGARAARDIAEQHTPDVAGRAFAARLSELAAARRVRSRRTLVATGKQALERTARRMLR